MSNRASVELVKVDGEDVRAKGWKWTYGSFEGEAGNEEKQGYGWSAFWKCQEGASVPEVQHVQWDEFVRFFA